MRYRPPRSPAKRPVTVALGSPPHPHPATLRSISTSGARIDCATPIDPGDRLTLVIQGKRWSARAVWWLDGEAGLAFTRPLTEGELSAIQNQGGVSARAARHAPTGNHHGFRELR